MADDKNQRIASDVLQAVGGKDNVSSALHCMTRLRLHLKDEGLADIDKIKEIPGVLGAQWAGGQLQVIIGQNVPKVHQAVIALGVASGGNIEENLDAPEEKLTWALVGQKIMGYLSGSMVPLIPVLMAAGLIKALTAIIGPDFLNLVSVESGVYIILDFVYDAGFYFIPILIGFNAAKALNINQLLGAYMGCILIAPDLIALATTEGASLDLFGMPIILNNYSQSVLPILLSVWIMSFLYKFFERYMPSTLSTIFTPFLTIFIMTPISLIALAPLGSILGTYVSQGLYAFGAVGGFIAVGVVAGLWEFLVLTGMHMVLIVLMMNELLTTGAMTGVATAGSFATWAAFGVALGAMIRLKNKEDKSTNLGFFISGIIGGVTEPVLYGTCFKFQRTFIALVIGGFAGGIYAGITGVKMFLMSSTNVLSLLGFMGGDMANMVNGTIACLIAFVLTAILTYFIGFTKEQIEGKPATGIEADESSSEQEGFQPVEEVTIESPIPGTVVPLDTVKDPTFASGVLGHGFAVEPIEGKVYAPFDGTVVTIFDTKHAIGLRSDEGVELLIHIGLETVNLGGKPFIAHCVDGQHVKKGDLLMEFDIDEIAKAGCDTIVPVIVSNEYEVGEAKVEGDRIIVGGPSEVSGALPAADTATA